MDDREDEDVGDGVDDDAKAESGQMNSLLLAHHEFGNVEKCDRALSGVVHQVEGLVAIRLWL